MKTFRADLHIHTCLSPCADLEMSPKNIIRQAKKNSINIVGICDHNTCENVPYVKKSAQGEGINVIGGFEVTSREEVHILALFDNDEELFSMQKMIYDNLHGLNDDRLYGDQVVVNEKDEILEFNKKLLIGATELTIETIVDKIHALNGLAIAAHIDRESFSIIGQLGFIPSGLQIDALEVSDAINAETFRHLRIPFVTSSDAHKLENIGSKYTDFFMEEATFEEMKKTLLEKGERKVLL